LAIFTAVGKVFQLIGAAILPLVELVFTAGRSFSYAMLQLQRFRDAVVAGAVTLQEFNGIVKFVLAPLASLVALLVEGAAAVYTWLGLDDLIEKFKSLGDSNSEASQEVENFKKELRGQNAELDDTAKKSKAAADIADELRKKLAQFKFETGKTVQNFDEMVRSSLQTRNNVVDLQMSQGKLTGITQNQLEVEDGINKFLDQRKGILTNLEEQVKKVKLDQALKIGDPKENAGKLGILNAAIKEVMNSSQGYISVLTGVIEKEQQLRRLQFIRANDIKTFQAEVDLARDLATALAAIEDAESAAERASLGRIEAMRKGNEATDARYRLDKALIGVSQIDADLIRKSFDLYQKQRTAIEAVGRTANLTAEARINEEQRIREETQKGIDLVVEQAADARARREDFSTGWNEAFRKFAEDASDANKKGAESFQYFTRTLEDAVVNLLGGVKSSFKSLMNTIVAELARIAVRQSIAASGAAITAAGGGGGLLKSLGSFIFGGGGGGTDFQGGGAIPGFAAGGSVMANKPVMVGERGPEMFLPSTAGSIIPNNQLKGQNNTNNTNVTYNINAVDASSFRSLVARDPAFIFNITEVGRRSTPQRSV
jgi:lambda family phage tail tape measure protein